MSTVQPSLFETAPAYPPGFRYMPDLICPAAEQRLIAAFQHFAFENFKFHGFTGQRRTVYFGWRYDFDQARLSPAEPIPTSLLPLRERAAVFAGLAPEDLPHVLVTEYREGAPIGWHRDRPSFGDVVGISLASACTFRFRRRAAAGWERASLTLAPNSVYLLRGPSRIEWEHSIPAVNALRYSVTFRTLRQH